jgi:hypothetical protein
VRLARLRAGAALTRAYVGVGGAGGDKVVVLWLRLDRGGEQAAPALTALSTMRNALPLPLEVEGGWSMEGALRPTAMRKLRIVTLGLAWMGNA